MDCTYLAVPTIGATTVAAAVAMENEVGNDDMLLQAQRHWGWGYGYGCGGWSERLVRFHNRGDAVRFGFDFGLTVLIV